MGYCESGDMYTKLKKQAKIGEYLEETQIVEWFVQIAMALQVPNTFAYFKTTLCSITVFV